MDELNEIARHEIQPGWDVFTADEELLGTVDQVSDASFTVANTSGATTSRRASTPCREFRRQKAAEGMTGASRAATRRRSNRRHSHQGGPG